MKLEQSFEVDAPLDRVWAALIDVERVAPCLPGAAVTGRNDDGSYNGTFSIKIGPTSASYAGKLEMRDVDEASHTATMYAQGNDKRGQGGASATIISNLQIVDDGRTKVDVDTDYRITGRLARFGRGGMIEDISEKLLRQFAASLQASLAGPDPEPAPTAAVGSALVVESAPEAGSARAVESAPAVASGSLDAGPTNGGSPDAELDALALARSVVWGQIQRHPAPVAGVAVVLLLVLLRMRGRR